MYKIDFYSDQNGREPVLEYLEELASKKDKDSRIKLNKIRDYMKILREHGTRAGEPFVKHLEGEIWELRPLRDSILFVGWDSNRFVLLHYFMKNITQHCRVYICRDAVGFFQPVYITVKEFHPAAQPGIQS